MNTDQQLPPSPDPVPGMNVGQLRQGLEGLPDEAQVLLENNGDRYSVVAVWNVGANTHDAGVVMRLLRIR